MRKKRIYASKNLIKYDNGRMLPLPPRYRCKLSTVITGYINSGAAAGNIYWYGNSMFSNSTLSTAGTYNSANPWPNPNVAIATYFPPGLGSLFGPSKYGGVRVFASKASIQITPPSNETDPVDFLLIPANGGIGVNSVDLQQPYVRYKLSTAYKGSTRLTNYMSTAKILGFTPRAVQDDISDELSSSYNAVGTQLVPTTVWYWQFYWRTANTSNLTQSMPYIVRTTYWVEFFDLQTGNLASTVS